MKKLAISLAIASALGLTACDDTSLQDVQDKTENLREQAKQDSVGAYVSFDPGNGVVNLPTDLLFSGTRDFTLETPAEAGAKAAGEAVDFTNPEAALGALDGWGTQNPFVVAINYDDGIILNPATIPSGDSVALYEMVMYPNLAVEGCTDATKAGQACQGVDKLQFGVDYFAQMTADGNIAVVPLKPLKAGTSYMLALTSEIKDSQGNALRPSSTYASVQKNIQTSPIVDPSIPTSELNASQAGIRLLQTMFSGFESVLERDFGANPDSIIYTQAFTTQSAGVPGTDPLQVVKLLNAQQFAAQAAESALNVAVPMIAQGFTVAQAFAGQGVIENNPATLPYLLYNTANIYGAKINVPYYLDDATTGNPLLSRWEAACDSGVALMQLTDAQKAALAANAGPNQATCAAVGLADFGIDTERHLTKYNPVPEVKSMQELTVQITVPNLANANTFRGLIGMTPITERPENGWPVVILQHGITSQKEDMLAATGFLSAFGFATVAIDHPLHNSRGFTLGEGDSAMVVNASSSVEGNNPTHYLNLQSLLTARDNIRQSVADGLSLRLAINAMVDATAAVDAELNLVNPAAIDMNVIDESRVYYLGHSLGAITGTNLTAIANTPVPAERFLGATEGNLEAAQGLAAQVNALYKINGTVLSNPGSSIGNFLLESGAFGPLVKASVLAGLGNELTEDFMAFLTPESLGAIIAANPSCAAAATDQNTALVCAYNAFIAQASAEQQAGLAAGLQQFAFAAQAAIEAGDPSNYAQLLRATGTPVLMYEMVGDLAEDGMNPPDQVIPNSVATNPMAGTTGLASQLGLPQVVETISDSSGAVSGIVRFEIGTHSTLLDPSAPAGLESYAAQYGALNQEMQMIMSYFFNSDGRSIQIGNIAEFDICNIKDAVDCE